ncbi:NnrU family protein [Tropicimonas sp. TH_r6]|uniref:NnrU family protein n=1 Tax=Tropicimonas sp. TH_r6 TaxID=3082085 RepID=UPI0029535B1E|nr:NnrU family protein [Tropicimonas sp. TH_r6]MDV7142301.1 NnrU family protein [Tropicimonas sp. TH_r6]
MMPSGWGEFLAALVFFLVSHSIPVRPPVKAALVARLGASGFTLAYSALSLVALVWLIGAAGRAPVVMLWDWAPWQNHATFTAMALATVLAALAIGRPNPLSFGGARNEDFDPAAPGIVGWARHPLLVALLLWSVGHLLPNGQLAHVLLFGLFAGFCLLGMRLIDRRKRREMGAEEWRRLASGTPAIRPTRAGLLRLAAGAAVYGLLLLAHGPVIGIHPTL